jgi:hypothetical protein
VFLFKKKEEPESEKINRIYEKLKELYKFSEISEDRKRYLEEAISGYGYLNIPYIQALTELTPAEILYGLEIKWENSAAFIDGGFKFDRASVLARNNVKNSGWIKREGHNIKLINLAGLGNGNQTKETGKFIDWLRQLLILPTGNPGNNIFNTTIYLIPFHPREFGCAYLPKSSEVSGKLLDEQLYEYTGLDAKGQVQTFITLAQLAGHPVIYDVLPQTGRFSKAVLANPEIARWYDVPELEKIYCKNLDAVAEKLSANRDSEDIELVKDIYIQSMKGSAGDLTSYFREIFDEFETEMNEIKKKYSDEMLKKANQTKLHRRVREITAAVENEKRKVQEENITKQTEIVEALIKEGLWAAPGGAWCSAGVPVYDKMSQCNTYPTFKHYDYKGEDVTNFANLDCQTPYYFCFLEDGSLNKPVVDYFINYMKQLRREYNFDGYRVDHIDHIVDKVSEKDGIPISYRAPKFVLDKLNKTMKSEIPHFASLAEYMLWDDFLEEYHQQMHFDLLWGNDIVAQCEKTPQKIVEDNQHLANYNINLKEKLSILKTYNNQDGEFRSIDQYPGQLGEDGALYKWFKYKCLPGGKFAQRPVLYIDGDESFTRHGIERVIGEEVSMQREKHTSFYNKFDALDRFVKSQEIITDGEAQIILQEEDGFTAWVISKEPSKTAFLMVSNHKCPAEKVNKTDENGECYSEIVEGQPVYNKTLQLPGDYILKNEYVIDDKDYVPASTSGNSTLNFEKLTPGEFKIYELRKC